MAKKRVAKTTTIEENDLVVSKKDQKLRAYTLANKGFDPESYDFDESFQPADTSKPFEVHTTAEMVECLSKDKNIELDAKVLTVNNKGLKRKAFTKKDFVEAFKKGPGKQLKESTFDAFATDQDSATNRLGDEFIPLLGGPFYKNLYYYQDYIRMHSQCFYAYHHDPIAKAIVKITTDFALGRGFKVDCDDKRALAIWQATEEVNDLQEMMNQFANESSIYGENMIWKLPNNETKITYRLPANEKPPVGLLPRFRLVDPSNIVEIVTYPEDITRRLFYVWLAPTQYQIYTGSDPKNPDKVQPVLKFIYRQIPAEEMMHFKLNGVSNEKRGRSDLFPVLGYLKRFRDAINYGLIAQQKQAAWAIDTEVDGDQTDIDSYASSQASLGTIADAGSEFVHSTKIKRTFLSPAMSRSSGSGDIFQWILSMVCAGVQIPISYLGTFLSGGQTRASAIVATEPVAKKFEMRQEYLKSAIQAMWDATMEYFGLGKVECRITFPEIITQDRSAKLKDLALAETQGWISKEVAANIAAKELEIDNYEFKQDSGPAEPPPTTNPLSAPALAPKKPSAVTGDEKVKIKKNNAQ